MSKTGKFSICCAQYWKQNLTWRSSLRGTIDIIPCEKKRSNAMLPMQSGLIQAMIWSACDSHETNYQQLLNLESKCVWNILLKVNPLQGEKGTKLCFPYGGQSLCSKQTYSSNVTPGHFAPLWSPRNHENDHHHGSSLRRAIDWTSGLCRVETVSVRGHLHNNSSSFKKDLLFAV